MTAPVLLVKSGGEAAVAEWQALFAPLLPHCSVRWWDDPTVAAEDVRYVFVWEPEPGRLAALPNLRLIISSGAGVDHLTKDPLLPVHVPIVKMGAAEAAQRMAEYVLATVLFHHRRFHDFVEAQRHRRWAYLETTEARHRTVGVMGLGTLGAAAAVALRDAGFRVRGWSRTAKMLAGVETFAGRESLPAFLAPVEILVCLLAATPETARIIDASLLGRLPRGACVVNAARGVHVVLDDLIAALGSGQVAAATLDVFETEPLPPDSPAWTHPRILVTPHVASYPDRAARARFVADAITALESGRPLPNRFDPQRGY